MVQNFIIPSYELLPSNFRLVHKNVVTALFKQFKETVPYIFTRLNTGTCKITLVTCTNK